MPTVDLVLASTCKFNANFISNFYTFRVTYEVTNAFGRFFKLKPKVCTRYASGTNRVEIFNDLKKYFVPDWHKGFIWDAIGENVTTAREAFDAIHNDGKITNSTVRAASRLWSTRIQEVLKIRKVCECHIPVWDGVNLTDHIAEATKNGWYRTKSFVGERD